MSLPSWPNWYDPRINVVRDIPTELEEGFEPPVLVIEPPTRSTIRPEIYKEFLPGVPKDDKTGIPTPGSYFNQLPASAIPTKETKTKETKETKKTKEHKKKKEHRETTKK